MRVCVVMFYDDNVKEYGDINCKINKLYCDKHGFDFLVSHEKVYTTRHAAWERLPLILKHLDKYDYIVWIDADAFFYVNENSIADIIDEYSYKDFIFSKDIGNMNVNTGVFVVKNTDYSREFLKEWAYNDELYRRNPFKSWWDQGVLILMMMWDIKEINMHSKVLPYGVLQHFLKDKKTVYMKQPCAMHLPGNSTIQRVKEATEYYEQISTHFRTLE